MRNKTCEDAADAVVKAGGGRDLIISTIRSVFGQGYNRGYTAKGSDIKKATASKRAARNISFKKELDQIEDVRG
jgi:hypothetical protein